MEKPNRVLPGAIFRTLKYILLVPVLASAACGVEFLKPLTTDQMAAYPDVIALAKDRYTGTRISGPLNLSHWSTEATDTRLMASFQIPTNVSGADADYRGLMRDLSDYCAYRGGHSDDFGTATARRWQALRAQSSDLQVVKSEMGSPPNFGCTAPSGALFFGNAKRLPGASTDVYIVVRINEGRGGSAIPFSDYPEVQ